MEKQEIKSFVQNWIQTIWEGQQLERLGDFYRYDLEGYYNEDKVTFDSLKAKAQVIKNHMKNLKVEILHLVIEKDRFALHANQKFQTHDERELSVPSMLFAHLKDGKIHRYWLKTKMPLDFN